jgi:diguanylate cyclase (GGDEF)-like protein/PAS domain S-box-containing protein
VNQRLCDMVGYSREELQEKTFLHLTHPEDPASELDYDRQMRTGKIHDSIREKRYIRKDGSLCWIRLSVSIVASAEGEPEHFIAVIEDINAQKQAQAQLQHQALHDPLTLMPNRALFNDRLEHAIAWAERTMGQAALLRMDLNRFKEINDTFGHHYDDLILRQVADKLSDLLRESDTVARLGGDEFALVMPATDEQGAVKAAERILAMLSQSFVIEGQSLSIDTSIGIAVFPAQGADVQTLLRHADVAMYVAKYTKTGYAVYSPKHDVNSAERLLLMNDLREAIEQKQLVLQYQPVMRLRTGEIKQVEALVRWQHPERGIILPDEFISLAEHTGLIEPLTLWVLREAVTQCRVWRDQGLEMRVSVNISAHNLRGEVLPSLVSTLLEMQDVPPASLQLEITESAVMEDREHALQILTTLRELGVSVSIDDFGTGHSSLEYLHCLPVSEIKIDRGFVKDGAAETGACPIVRTIVELGHTLGLAVVAEGVETQASLDDLRNLGCDLAQGFYICHPLPGEQLTSWLHERQNVMPRLSA